MAKRDTLQIGHPLLKAGNKEITDFGSDSLKQLLEDLKDTMYKNKLIGIAAPQIGENFCVFVTEPRETPFRPKDQSDELRVYINPQMVQESDDHQIIWEGCASVLTGQLFGPVKKPKTVTIVAYDENGRKFRFTADGILGRVIQHEYDHLQGVEFIQKADDYKKLMHVEFYKERIKPLRKHQRACQITIKNLMLLP